MDLFAISLLSGSIGGNAVAGLKSFDLGIVLNTACGAIGGSLGGFALEVLRGPDHLLVAGSLALQVISGVGGGFLLTALVAMFRRSRWR